MRKKKIPGARMSLRRNKNGKKNQEEGRRVCDVSFTTIYNLFGREKADLKRWGEWGLENALRSAPFSTRMSTIFSFAFIFILRESFYFVCAFRLSHTVHTHSCGWSTSHCHPFIWWSSSFFFFCLLAFFFLFVILWLLRSCFQFCSHGVTNLRPLSHQSDSLLFSYRSLCVGR